MHCATDFGNCLIRSWTTLEWQLIIYTVVSYILYEKIFWEEAVDIHLETDNAEITTLKFTSY